MSSRTAVARPLRLPVSPTLARRILIGLLLAAQIVWLGGHLTLVSKGLINPWKLGGYGMYTTANPRAQTHVYYHDDAAGRWTEIPRSENRFNSFLFDSRNHLHVFRCRPPGEFALTGFMDENPHLRYRPLTIALSEATLTRDPVGAARKIYATIEFAWSGQTKFGYRGKLCGHQFRGVIEYAAPN